MLWPRDLSDLVATDRRDVLSIYLDVDPTKPENQSAHPAYVIWLRNALRDILNGLSKEDRRTLGATAQELENFVASTRPAGRGLVLFAAPGLWRQHFLPVPVSNHAAYGRPNTMPLLWTIDEYEPYAILFIDSEHARILAAYLGRTAVVEEEALELDTSDWRFKAGRPPTFTKAAGTGASRGAQRDTFEARVEDHVRRFWQSAADATAKWLDELQIGRLIIGGPETATSAVREMLPEHAHDSVVGLVPLPAYSDVSEIRERTLPVALAAERRREDELVAQLLDLAGAHSGGVVGKAATLNALQQGQAMMLVADRELTGTVWQCVECNYVSVDATDRCAVCGGAVEEFELPQLLPLLAYRSGAAIELVGKDAAERLRAHEGLGALLRYVQAPAAEPA
ncbi:MAG: VLRF1 family aeRF1-type release factor [bacterium]